MWWHMYFLDSTFSDMYLSDQEVKFFALNEWKFEFCEYKSKSNFATRCDAYIIIQIRRHLLYQTADIKTYNGFPYHHIGLPSAACSSGAGAADRRPPWCVRGRAPAPEWRPSAIRARTSCAAGRVTAEPFSCSTSRPNSFYRVALQIRSENSVFQPDDHNFKPNNSMDGATVFLVGERKRLIADVLRDVGSVPFYQLPPDASSLTSLLNLLPIISRCCVALSLRLTARLGDGRKSSREMTPNVKTARKNTAIGLCWNIRRPGAANSRTR